MPLCWQPPRAPAGSSCWCKQSSGHTEPGQVKPFSSSLASIRTARRAAVPVLELLPSVPGSACVPVQAAPSQLPQLPVPAKRYLSLTLDSGLMLLQKVFPCCALRLHYSICQNQPPSRCRRKQNTLDVSLIIKQKYKY